MHGCLHTRLAFVQLPDVLPILRAVYQSIEAPHEPAPRVVTRAGTYDAFMMNVTSPRHRLCARKMLASLALVASMAQRSAAQEVIVSKQRAAAQPGHAPREARPAVFARRKADNVVQALL